MTPPEPTQVVCAQCHAVVAVEEDWRLVLCPNCHAPIQRMADDEKFD